MAYYTRVLSQDDQFPTLEELADLLQAQHPGFKPGAPSIPRHFAEWVGSERIPAAARHPITDE